jgi:hypothetical protein
LELGLEGHCFHAGRGGGERRGRREIGVDEIFFSRLPRSPFSAPRYPKNWGQTTR